MASEYLKWKYRDVRPEERPELTPRERRSNWWHYHKWHVALAAVLLLIMLDVGKSVLGLGAVHPDYQVAYVGGAYLPDETAAALEQALAAYGEDINGDGRVAVQLNRYLVDAVGDEGAAYASANRVKLMADLERSDSAFFILEEPETFQFQYQILRKLDGTLPTGYERDVSDCYLPWSECPVLASLDLGKYTATVLGESVTGSSGEWLSEMFFARRGYWAEQKYAAAYDAMWNILTEGAIP